MGGIVHYLVILNEITRDSPVRSGGEGRGKISFVTCYFSVETLDWNPHQNTMNFHPLYLLPSVCC